MAAAQNDTHILHSIPISYCLTGYGTTVAGYPILRLSEIVLGIAQIIRLDAKKQYKRKQQYAKQNLLKRQFSADQPNQNGVAGPPESHLLTAPDNRILQTSHMPTEWRSENPMSSTKSKKQPRNVELLKEMGKKIKAVKNSFLTALVFMHKNLLKPKITY